MHIKLQENTPKTVESLVFAMLDILKDIGIPVNNTDRRLERMAKACMAVGKIKRSLKEAVSAENGEYLRSRDIIAFENEQYGESIADASYDDIRRQDLKLLVEAGLVLNSSSKEKQATNNPSRGYALSPNFAKLLKQYKTSNWDNALADYVQEAVSLKEELERKRDLEKVPVTLPGGRTIDLSFGEHNNLQKAVIEVFLPLFGFGAEVLYVGDTKDKYLHLEKEALEALNFFTLEHEELPDVVAYSKEKISFILLRHITLQENGVKSESAK